MRNLFGRASKAVLVLPILASLLVANYSSLADEIALMKQDTTLREKRKRWHKNLAKDIYVEEAVNVLADLKMSNIKAGKVADIKN